MTPREQRLRQRIDQLLDDRETLRAKIAELRAANDRHSHAKYAQRNRAELWRIRAERMAATIERQERTLNTLRTLAVNLPSSAGGSAPREAGTRTKEPAGRLIRHPLPVGSIAGTSLRTGE